MTKINFILSLHEMLYDLPRKDVEERLGFYSEMIEDRMEDGLAEEEAVAAIGTIEEIAAQIREDISPDIPTEVKPITTKRRLKAWEIVLLAVGSPVWLSLLIAAVAVVIALYASLWAVLISFWAVFASFAGCAAGCIAGGVVFIVNGNILQGIATIGMGFICAGLSILCFFGCKAAIKGVLILTKKFAMRLKKVFKKLGEA